jgi:hypothetical protein
LIVEFFKFSVVYPFGEDLPDELDVGGIELTLEVRRDAM